MHHSMFVFHCHLSLHRSKEEALTPVANDWRYLENFCVFESNKSIYLINNTKLYPTKKYPSSLFASFSPLETFYPWYYKRYIYFRNNTLTSFPPGMPVLDNVYLFITRGWGGWNNIYHHTEWVNNLLRYVHNAASLPRVKTPYFCHLDGERGLLPRSPQPEPHLRGPERPFSLGL